MFVPHRFLHKLLDDEDEKRVCTETLVFAGVKKLLCLLHMHPPPERNYTAMQYQSLLAQFKTTYGEMSDEEHYFRV